MPAGQIISALTLTLTDGTTADANQVMALFNQILQNVNANAAENGVNTSITQLQGLTTPLSIAQGGTGTTVGPLAPGVRAEFAGFAAPTGWYIEDGTAYSRTVDAALFAALSQTGTFTGTSGSNQITLNANPAYQAIATVTGVTYTGTSGSPAITLSAALSSGNPLGWPFQGPGVPANTLVTGYDPTTSIVTLSNNLTSAETGVLGYIGTPWVVEGTGVPTGTFITAYNNSSFVATLSNNLTGNASALTYIMSPYGLGDHATTFNVPNTINRSLVGAGGLYGIGQIFGETNHLLGAAELPVTAYTDSGHANPVGYNPVSVGGGAGTVLSGAGADLYNSGIGYAQISNPSGGHIHNNMQPSMASLRIIKR